MVVFSQSLPSIHFPGLVAAVPRQALAGMGPRASSRRAGLFWAFRGGEDCGVKYFVANAVPRR
jgi:hypothetical protein